MDRILLVDDEPGALRFLSAELSKRGYDVETATTGEEAIEKIKKSHPLLMLLDIRMPGMGGIETLRQARALDPNLGVIMVTAVNEEDIAQEAMKLGAHDYITKPIDFNYLNLVVMTKIVDLAG